METTVIIKAEYPFTKDIELVFEKGQWNNFKIKKVIHEILEGNDYHDMAMHNGRSGTTKLYLLIDALDSKKFTKWQLKILKQCVAEIKDECNKVLGFIANNI